MYGLTPQETQLAGIRLEPGVDPRGIIDSWKLGGDTKKLVDALIRLDDERGEYRIPPQLREFLFMSD